MEILKNIQQIKSKFELLEGSLGLVPTMGALHKGHLSLFENARKENDILVASLFVNPKQFGPDEDYQDYPRLLEKDIEILSQSGVDYVFLPNQGHIYPSGFSTYVNNNLEGNVFEGEFRKNHFQGVLTVVAKLMNIIKPNKIYFGEKDAQQLFLVRKMISDLNFDIELRSIRTIREPNGLACSSRNFYLSDKEIEEAGSIYKSLCSSSKLWKNGERNLKVIKNEFIQGVKGIDNIKIQYVETVDPGTFSPIDDGEEAILIVAVVLGNIRLIDNISLN